MLEFRSDNYLSVHVCNPGAVLSVKGEDAFTYLQSQFSNDLRSSCEQPLTYGFWLGRKGKVDADSFVLRLSDEEGGDFLVFSYFCKASALIEKLEENIIADDVEIEDVTDSYQLWVLWGGELASFLTECGFSMPHAGTFHRERDIFLIPGRRSAQPNVDFLFKRSDISTLITGRSRFAQKHDVRDVSRTALDFERIRSGYPAVPFDLNSDVLPQEGGAEKAGVSFEKGCYLGQEVMARLQAMGRPQRALYALKMEEQPDSLPRKLYLGDKVVGTLSSQAQRAGIRIGAGLLKCRAIEGNTRLALKPNGFSSIEILNTFSNGA